MSRLERIATWERSADEIVGHYKRLSAACDAAIQAGAHDINGPLHDAIWRAFSGMLAQIDVHDWLNWFIYENDCGAKAMEAKGCGKPGPTPIKTTRQLARLIVESEEHHQAAG